MLTTVFKFCHIYRVQQPSNVPEPTYELVVKHGDDINMDKNPAYSVQDTSMKYDDVKMDRNPAYSVQDTLMKYDDVNMDRNPAYSVNTRHYDYISEKDQTETEQ